MSVKTVAEDLVMTKDWLLKKVTRSEVDAQLGMDRPRWLELRSMLCEGDELWLFCSSDESWYKRCGRSGYSIVRDGVIIKSLITMRN